MIASIRPQRSFPVCKKCQRPIRGHVGPTGSSCSQPSPQFLTGVPLFSSLLPPDLVNIQEELEASIKAHEDQIQHLSAELGDLRLNSTSWFSPQNVSTESGPVINAVQTMHNMAAKDAATPLPHRPIAPSHLASLPVPQPQPSTFPAASAAYDSPQVIDLLQQLLHHLQAPVVSVPKFSHGFTPSAPASMSELCQQLALKQQADQLSAAIPLLESGGSISSGHPSIKGKSPGDLTFSAPVKFTQLWPHQFVCQLDSSTIAYKDLDLPQFMFGFIECVRHLAVIEQPKMLAHLSHLMDLASHFQWPAVRAYHARVLKALEQGSATWDSDLYRFQTGILLPSQEISSHPPTPAGHKKISKESVCRDWNLSSCHQPCPSGRLHHCLVCKVDDNKALVCPKHRCLEPRMTTPSCSITHLLVLASSSSQSFYLSSFFAASIMCFTSTEHFLTLSSSIFEIEHRSSEGCTRFISCCCHC